MKKILALLMTTVLAVSVTACGNAGIDNPPSDSEQTSQPLDTEQSPGPMDTEETSEPTNTEEDSEPVDAADTTDTSDTEALISKIYDQNPFDLNMVTMPVDLTDEYALRGYTGLEMEEADKIAEAAFSEPMMGQACSIVVVKVNDANDAADIAQKMADGIDQNKWICMEADNLRVVTSNQYVLLVMIMSDLADTVTVDEVVDAFTAVCGSTDGEYEKK